MTKSQIRAMLMDRDDVLAVRITRDGEIHIKTDRERGDGGPTPWWMFAGRITDAEYTT